MRTAAIALISVAFAGGLVVAALKAQTTQAAASARAGTSNMLAHNVYFKLSDDSPQAVEKLVQACHKYLSGHPGAVFFACGTLEQGLDRPVNERDWDVALHVVFEDRAAHDRYQAAERHQQFIAENKANWARVRVFDSTVKESAD